MKICILFLLLSVSSHVYAFTTLPVGRMSKSRNKAEVGHCASSLIDTDPVQEKPHVRRFYETYQWTNPDSNQTHKINYRVEGKPTDPPILLIHGFGGKTLLRINLQFINSNMTPFTFLATNLFIV